MSIFITKIKLYNFRRFREFVIEPNTKNNILIGDNESGKSTILEAIDLVSGGNNRRVEAIGLDNLLNIEAVTEFINSDRCYADLPKLRVELYLSGASDPSVNGENNSDKIECDGIKLVCEPNEDYKTEITFAMDAQSDYFPYEYYSIRFSTFADQVYTGYKRKLRCAMVNSDNMDSEYATNDFIKRTYYQYTGDDAKERAIFRSKYRQMRKVFCADSLKPLNDRIPQEKHYTFGLKNSPASALENNLMIYEDEISIDNKGTGRQIFIKTDFALEHAGSNVDVILLEEPETHLSHVNLKKLIQKIAKTQAGQIFIATHNSLISTRLELNNVIILHCDGEKRPVTLKSLNLETAAYFKKTPPASITEFVLSRKTILFDDKIKYESRFTAKGIVCDNTSLLNSWRCSKNVCQFITDNLGIRIGSNRADEDNTTIEVVTDSVRIAEYTRNNSIVKLHYQNGSKKGYMHKNWGETKGEDKYTDVCVLLNKTTSKKMAAGKLAELAPMTKNKLYVAITRAKGNVYIFDE